MKKILLHLVCLVLFLSTKSAAQAALLFQEDTFNTIDSDGIILDNNNNTGGDISIKFGATLGETIKWNGSTFDFSDAIDMNSNQLIEARLENLSALPGGASGPGAVTGRIVQLTSSDSTAPGCTTNPCSAGTYIWNGTIWERISNITNNLSNTYTLDSDSTGGDVTFRYGTTNAETIAWNNTNTRFDFSDDLNITGGIIVSGSSGFGTTTPATVVDIAGAIALRVSALSLSNGTNNNVTTTVASFHRITGPTAAFTITGLDNGVDGRLLYLFNNTAQAMTIANESASSTAANRITTLTGADVVTTGTGATLLIYDAVDSRWILIAKSL